MYINHSPILYIVDKNIRYQAVRWLQNINFKYIWNILYLYLINVYLNLPDYIYHNIGKNFISRKFCQFAILLKITIKNISVKAH